MKTAGFHSFLFFNNKTIKMLDISRI